MTDKTHLRKEYWIGVGQGLLLTMAMFGLVLIARAALIS